MEFTDFIAIPAVVVVAYFVGLVIKTLGTSEKLDKWIPVICGATGMVVTMAVYLTTPGFIPADNWVVALAIGIVSGLSATGANQIYKQLSK